MDFQREDADGEYTVLTQPGIRIRVKTNFLIPVKYEGFYLDDSVRVVSNNGKNTIREGTIVQLHKHHKENRLAYYYLSEPNGKSLKKRYFSNDLERIAP